MCTSGWIKTKQGYVIFKNRDLPKNKPFPKNFLKITKKEIYFYDKQKTGYWFAANKYFSINTLTGPYKEKRKGFKSSGTFHISKKVIKQAKSPKEATKLFNKLILEEKIENSRTVLIANEKEAIIIEIALNKIKQKTYNKNIFKTNTFQLLKKLDSKNKEQHERLKNTKKLCKKIKSSFKLTKILKYHSNASVGNICRHDSSETISSAILEKKKTKYILYYITNGSPCKNKYKKKEFKLI
ncbi:hypothetical protein GW932_01535 [archaeon]|nr:hypothetical protein [archaeon]